MNDISNIFVFRTNINTLNDKLLIKDVLSEHDEIKEWSVDLQDCDKVLRIVSPTITASRVIALINQTGYDCHELE